MDPEKIIEDIAKELGTTLKSMAKAKTTDEKLVYSKITKNLCESLGVFFDFANDMMMDYDDHDCMDGFDD